MLPTLVFIIAVAALGALWILPLYWVCKYAEEQKKDHRIVFLIGFFTSWVIGLIFALVLPVLDEKALAALKKKGDKTPMGTQGIIIGGIGVCMLILVGFIIFLSSL